MNQQPKSHQNLDINDSLFREAQIAQAGGNLSQIQNINIYSVLNSSGLLRSRQINPSNQQDYNSRKILLNKVKQYWIKDVLEKSLHSKALIELGLEERLDAVERPSEIAQENYNDLRQSLPQDKNNIDIFKEMAQGRTLLILGEPGAGKTTFMLRIAKSLIADNEQNLSLPIPVILNLSSWANKRQSIAQWLIQELSNNYKVSKSIAKYWVENQQLLLMFDGLDEVKAEYRDACVKVLNEFMQNYGETEIVVCSRVKDYESLSNRLAIQRGVCIQSLTSEQINDYLDRAGNQLQAVKSLLETDTALQELVKSPLILSIITLAYRNISTEDLPKFDSIEEHRQHLFNSYIQRMFVRRATKKLYLEDKARNWLNWLAYKMSQNSQTIFSIEHMQPRWLKNGWQKLIYCIVILVFSSLIIGGIFTFFSLVHTILFLESVSIQKVVLDVDDNLLIGLISGFVCMINGYFINNEEIILPTHRWKLSRTKAFKGLMTGIKAGLIWGTLFGIIVIISFIFFPVYDWSLEEDNIFSNKFIGLFISLACGILFTLLFQAIKKIFGYSNIRQKISLPDKLKIYFKQVFLWGICIGILIWITSWIVPNILISFVIQIICIIFISNIIISLLFGMIGVFLGGRDSVDIQKNILSDNPLRQALINTAISCVIGFIIGVSIGGIYIIWSNYFGFIPENLKGIKGIKFIIGLGYVLGFYGLTTGFACIQHLSLRFILHRYNYISWNYTHFLEYATERIFLQKVGGGYIFVHRLLLEHFAALYQTSQPSSTTRSNLTKTKKRKVFSFFLIATTILISLLGYQFRKEIEKSVQNFIEYLEDPSRKRTIDYYSGVIKKNPKNANNYNSRGDAYVEKEEYDLAIADFSEAIKLDNKYIDAYKNRGDAYLKKREYNLAIADYSEAIKLNPKDTSAYKNRGDAYLKKREYNLAITDFSEAIKLDNKYIYAYKNRGDAYLKKREYNLAIADFSEAIKLDNKYIYAYNFRGYTYLQSGEYDLAIADFSEAIKLDNKYIDAYKNRGDAYVGKEEYNLAIADFSEALKLDNKYIYAYNQRGYTYLQKGEYDLAIADLGEAIKLNNKYIYAYINRGDAYLKKGEYALVIADFSEALKLDNKYIYAYNQRGYTYLQKGEYDLAIADLSEAIKLDHKYINAYINRGYAYSKKGEYNLAIADFSETIKLDSKYIHAYNQRGDAYLKKGEYDLAIADLSEAIKLDNKYIYAYNKRGYTYVRKGEYDLAIADLSEAIKLDHKYINAYINRGYAYSKKGEYDLAIADYSEALKLDPKDTYVYNKRRDAYLKKR